MKKLAVVVFVLGMVGFVHAADVKNDPTGTWKWKAKFGDKEIERTLKLELKDGKLTGAIVGKTDTKIEEGTFKDGDVTFSATQERKGEKFVTKYAAKVDGDTMKGTITSERGGKEMKLEFEAKKVKDEKKD